MTNVSPIDELACRLALWRTEGVGPVKFSQIIEKYASVKKYIDMHSNLDAHAHSLSPSLSSFIQIAEKTWKLVEQDLKWAEQSDCFILTINDKNYPAQLKQISAPPPLLFVQGNAALLSQKQIAMVGSRNPTSAGTDNAYQFARFFAANGLIVTSGLALGIDAASHEGALSAQGKTIAVMGAGPDIIYPKRHQALARKIIGNGCLATEFPTGVSPAAVNFPRRNRLISGLSLGVLVVEAAYASGSLVTAKYALDQNREIFAIPGSIQNPLSRGCHALIKQGAKLVETAQDIFEEIDFLQMQKTEFLEKNPKTLQNSKAINSAAENPFLNYVDFETTAMDVIIKRSGLTAEKVSSILLLLELDAYIASVPGGYRRLN